MSKTKQKLPECRWTEDEDGNWDTACDNKNCFIVAGPKENNYGFCPYCGHKLSAKPASPNE